MGLQVLTKGHRHGAGQLHVLQEGLAIVGMLRDLVPHADKGVMMNPGLVRQDESLPLSGLGVYPGEPREPWGNELEALADRGQTRRTVLPIVSRWVDDNPSRSQTAQRASIDL